MEKNCHALGGQNERLNKATVTIKNTWLMFADLPLVPRMLVNLLLITKNSAVSVADLGRQNEPNESKRAPISQPTKYLMDCRVKIRVLAPEFFL